MEPFPSSIYSSPPSGGIFRKPTSCDPFFGGQICRSSEKQLTLQFARATHPPKKGPRMSLLLLMVQKSGDHHLKCIKPCNGIFSIITWLAGFLNHQQYFITLCYFIGLSIIRQVHNIEKLHHHQKNSTTLFCSFAWDDNSLKSGGSNIILRSPKEPPNLVSGKSNEWLQKPFQSCRR